MTRGGKRRGAGRRSAFGYGVALERRSIRLPTEVWARIDALAAELATTDDAAIAAMFHPRSMPRPTDPHDPR